MTTIPNFETSRWRTAANLKIVLSLYLSRKSSDFNEIWYADGGENAFTYYVSSFSQCDGYDVGISQRAGASAGPQAARARRPAPACGPAPAGAVAGLRPALQQQYMFHRNCTHYLSPKSLLHCDRTRLVLINLIIYFILLQDYNSLLKRFPVPSRIPSLKV